jgi:hypothetical protein
MGIVEPGDVAGSADAIRADVIRLVGALVEAGE